MRPNRKVSLGVELPESLMQKMEACLDSPVSGVRSKRELVETALLNYLDQAEPVIAKLEKELLILKNMKS